MHTISCIGGSCIDRVGGGDQCIMGGPLAVKAYSSINDGCLKLSMSQPSQ